MSVYIGIDLGTSGCRGVALDEQESVRASAECPLKAPESDDFGIHQAPDIWWRAVQHVLKALSSRLSGERVKRLAVNGTSSTLIACDHAGSPLLPALMYNDQRPAQYARLIENIAPATSAARGASSSLSKFLWFADKLDDQSLHVLHQSDWILGKLTGYWGISDYNNSLKLGYDPVMLRWPEWIANAGIDVSRFPEVVAPGSSVAAIDSSVAKVCGLPTDTEVVAGTTDSIAAFIASGANCLGDGVTSLGSTLVIKLLSDKPVFAPEYGVYSHRLGRYWLAGGASNSGGAVLQQFFTREELDRMTPELKPDTDTGLDYYPLSRPGERFPENDPDKQPRLSPEAASPVQFFQGMLEGIAHIEAAGYKKLHSLGTPDVRSIRTAGGGASNDAWEKIRIKQFDPSVSFRPARFIEAACGTALLALRGVPE